MWTQITVSFGVFHVSWIQLTHVSHTEQPTTLSRHITRY